MNKTLPMIGCAILIGCLSCSGRPRELLEEAKTDAAKAREELASLADEIPALREKTERLIRSIDRKQLETVKESCEAIDLQLGTRVLARYYRAFALETREGPKAVIEHLDKDIAGLPEDDQERAALEALRKYFDAKGTISTKDAVLLVIAIALEAKFPHGRGSILIAPLLESSSKENGARRDPKASK